jgi:hypothetical protein
MDNLLVRSTTSLALALLLTAVPVRAMSRDDRASAYATCAAYSQLMHAMALRGDTPARRELAQQTAQVGLYATTLSFLLSSAPVAQARIQLDTQHMLAMLDGDLGNAALVINTYAARCKTFIEADHAAVLAEGLWPPAPTPLGPRPGSRSR